MKFGMRDFIFTRILLFLSKNGYQMEIAGVINLANPYSHDFGAFFFFSSPSKEKVDLENLILLLKP